MHDIKFIREHPEEFDAGLKRRGLAPMAQSLMEFDRTLRQAQTDLQENQTQANAIAREIGTAKRDGADAAPLMRKAEEIKSARALLEAREREVTEQVRTILAAIPNLPAADVPEGRDETGNVRVRGWARRANSTTSRSNMTRSGPSSA